MAMEGQGARLLGDIEEESLENLLTTLRRTTLPQHPRLHIPALDTLWNSQKTPRLEISGRGLPLLYHIIHISITHHNGVIAIIDLDGRFNISCLPPTCDVKHVNVFRVPPNSLGGEGEWRELMRGVEKWMVGGEHESMGREWIVTAVCGVGGGLGMGMVEGVNVVVGWRGWLRVERVEVLGFGPGMSVEEALRERGRRQGAVDRAGWRAVSDYGEYTWKDA